VQLVVVVVLHVVVVVEQPQPSSYVTLWQVLEQPQCAAQVWAPDDVWLPLDEPPPAPETVDEHPVADAATAPMPPAMSDPRIRESSRFTRPPSRTNSTSPHDEAWRPSSSCCCSW
jgi:hypothetical protein